jgi:hypothetical protein
LHQQKILEQVNTFNNLDCYVDSIMLSYEVGKEDMECMEATRTLDYVFRTSFET